MNDSVSAWRSGLTSADAMIVAPSLDDTLFWNSVLASVGFHITSARGFPDAKARMAARPPAVLVTELRLGEYNGLHLVSRGLFINPRLAAVLVTHTYDPVLQADADALGAAYVVRPVAGKELLAAVFRTVFRAGPMPTRPPFERRVAERRRTHAPALAAERRRVGERRRDYITLVSEASHLST